MNIKRKTDTIMLKKILVEHKLDKINELSKATGINRTTLGAILSGKSQPSAEIMYKLIKALEIAPSEAGEIFFNPNLRDT